ncbi:sodium/hydrogen exchanger [Amycolatopsis mediterranei S699]|uniref:Sodium/hydrogen exchanger n=2 Tax=Amycolatopsis mediterranei TaxID=33910 RepID=A0A0H3D9Z3_AMYMU|nr:cation:proton antiporter [Amycolatopsis mediterranei]ADJ47466.1 sodium/hydrogen exchanger [Amycolatopsis mediterranei U32]AEK44315.1 sodium/hydrogen exchanger [Amycolatopsis mediterranei S699]AFO79177.1 sodium/hydrogen exchanger [Amycolatopsis mediterranei S699]AGT86305.1 sodium/hydrogen exchanger [Amycolatopsis mediterranei RB]KDO12609.1 sodium:proton exchanger [Amycolatopsis mediterranei]
MDRIESFGLTLVVVAVVVTLALLSNRVSARLRVPAPAFFLVAAAVASDLVPSLRQVSLGAVEDVVTVALVVILFDGGMAIGARRLRDVLGTVLSVGVLGTFLTAGLLACAAHLLFGLPWLVALLLGAALAPTDPAVVFSVLGNREVTGRAGTIIQGESGANDPVGIALLLSLLTIAPGDGFGGASADVLGQFAGEMGIGAAVGLAGGWGLRWLLRRVGMPSEGLYPLRTLALSFLLYGAATVAHGSGFLAVFVAGVLVGDVAAPFKREIERFHSSLASLAEIVAFVVLGLTVSVSALVTTDAWWIGLVLAVVLTFVVRPLVVGPLLLRTRMPRGEKVFVLWSGLKGAVPILLGTYILAADQAQDVLVYEVIFVVVLFSVLVQGGLMPLVASRCAVRMREVEPQPWAVGVRVREEPGGARRLRVGPEAPAVGKSVKDLHLGDEMWISLVVRDGRPLRVRADLELESGDEVLVLTDPDCERDPTTIFTNGA